MPNQSTSDRRVRVVTADVPRGRLRPRRRTSSRSSFSYFRSGDFPIHALVAWWVLWLALSYTDLNEFIPPSGQTLALYALLLGSFALGYATTKRMQNVSPRAKANGALAFRASSVRMRLTIRAAALTCTAMLLISLHLSSAFTTDFLEYFAKLRVDEDTLQLTGTRSLDVLTKIFAFPLSYTVISVILASDSQHFRFSLLLCILNLLAFSYLWQVNYPLIHLFWFLVFHLLVQARRRGYFDGRVVAVMVVLFSTLIVSAANRFGGDILGGLQRYIVGYHLIGFSFYDHQYQDPNSILHIHSLGRSSLGFLDQMLEAVSKMIGGTYKAASSENATYNNDAIDIGLHEVKEFNAFGTLLFSLYRDFNVIGVLVGGFAYGALVTYALQRSTRNWVCGALFMILASSWMMGMMVNPLEQAYFWFAIVALGTFALVNRGAR